MTIHSLYIYDRHCICIYYQDWHRTRRPKPAVEGGLLPAVSEAVAHRPPERSSLGPAFSSPRNALGSGMTTVNVPSPVTPTPLLQTPQPPSGTTSTGLSFDEEAKLVYGVVLSLRNMVKKLSGRDEQFTNYRTSSYKLHLFETISGYRFVMLTDPNTESVRAHLRQIYVGPFLEFVVRNPLATMDSREQGIDNEYFRTSLDRYVRGLPFFGL